MLTQIKTGESLGNSQTRHHNVFILQHILEEDPQPEFILEAEERRAKELHKRLCI